VRDNNSAVVLSAEAGRKIPPLSLAAMDGCGNRTAPSENDAWQVPTLEYAVAISMGFATRQSCVLDTAVGMYFPSNFCRRRSSAGPSALKAGAVSIRLICRSLPRHRHLGDVPPSRAYFYLERNQGEP